MVAAKTNPVQRLGRFLRAPSRQLQEIKELHDFYRWVASVGGVNGLEWFLMRRDEKGLDADVSDDVAEYMHKLNRMTASASAYQRDLIVKAREARAITPEENYRRLCQRAKDEDKRRANLYSHVPKPQRKLTLAERMAAAATRLGLK